MTDLHRSYVVGLVIPALIVNALTIGFAWLSSTGAPEVLAEVEVLSDLCQPRERERICLVRVERLLKGESDSAVLQVRFPSGVLPEGVGLGGRGLVGEHFPHVGERLFVVLRRDRRCGYSVERFWLGGSRPERARSLVSLVALVHPLG